MDFERQVDLAVIHSYAMAHEIYLPAGKKVKIDTLVVTRIDGPVLEPTKLYEGTQHNFIHVHCGEELVMFVDVEEVPIPPNIQYLSISSVASTGMYQIGFDYEDD